VVHLCPWPGQQELTKKEREGIDKGEMHVDPAVPSSITAFPPGYIDKASEVRSRDGDGGHVCVGGRVGGGLGILVARDFGVVECCAATSARTGMWSGASTPVQKSKMGHSVRGGVPWQVIVGAADPAEPPGHG
jgi:hypothetical protein